VSNYLLTSPVWDASHNKTVSATTLHAAMVNAFGNSALDAGYLRVDQGEPGVDTHLAYVYNEDGDIVWFVDYAPVADFDFTNFPGLHAPYTDAWAGNPDTDKAWR
jgi:hypothetical protein